MPRSQGPRQRILFGGSFDPPTLAHRDAIEAAIEAFPEAELVVVPAGNPPHKRGRRMTPPELRLRMACIAFADLPRLRVSDEEIGRPGRSWTVETLARHRRELGPAGELYLLLGADSVLDLPGWREPHRILQLARVLTVPRPGFDHATVATLPGLSPEERQALQAGFLPRRARSGSSTEVRAAIVAGHDTSDLLDDRVRAFLEHERLYRES
jgi:nicotinate-nucleotide adenylyltransferase